MYLDKEKVEKCVSYIKNDSYIKHYNSLLSDIHKQNIAKVIYSPTTKELKFIYSIHVQEKIEEIKSLIEFRTEQIKNHFLK